MNGSMKFKMEYWKSCKLNNNNKKLSSHKWEFSPRRGLNYTSGSVALELCTGKMSL